VAIPVEHGFERLELTESRLALEAAGAKIFSVYLHA
jgi:putative intracellular protease/amidase